MKRYAIIKNGILYCRMLYSRADATTGVCGTVSAYL